jgi:hypothetical protein
MMIPGRKDPDSAFGPLFSTSEGLDPFGGEEEEVELQGEGRRVGVNGVREMPWSTKATFDLVKRRLWWVGTHPSCVVYTDGLAGGVHGYRTPR